MKKFKQKLTKWEDDLERKWYQQPISRQRRFVVIALGLYILLTALVIVYTYSSNGSAIKITPIKTPIVPQHSIQLKLDSIIIQKQQ